MLTQINLQTHFGGGEVYTAFLCRALSALDVSTKLLIHPYALFWQELKLPKNTTLVKTDPESLADSISSKDTWVLGHGALPPSVLKARGNRLKTAIAHMPVQGRRSERYKKHDMVFPVSGWVRQGLKSESLPTWDEPLYGVADLDARKRDFVIRKTSRYDWDERKVRDLLLGKMEPFVQPLLSKPKFVKKPGITLGIVSRITPIKQFPLLFSLLSKVLSQYPQFNLEIFGSGGYASIRDIRKALNPIHDQVRFWGQQKDVALVYSHLDYLITGLPEKEALGLNVIEAQVCGTPVIAPNAQPFIETILDNRTGFLYTDPRVDDGKSFEQLLKKILLMSKSLNPIVEIDHLNQFSFESFTHRIESIVNWAKKKGY